MIDKERYFEAYEGRDLRILDKHAADTIAEDLGSFDCQLDNHFAHVIMLTEQGLLSREDGAAIIKALLELKEMGPENIEMQSVVDDRMFLLSWYKNNELASQFQIDNDNYQKFLFDDWWYKYVFVDGGSKTCPNDGMSHQLITAATYPRWQQWGTLYGVSRYSMVMLTSMGCPPYLTNYFETEYARMAELAFMQRATVLRFSSEITRISNMEDRKGFGARVSSLYREYIRFENQIYFREVSAQDQGIEMYQMLFKAVNLEEQVKKLDEEIEELYNYVSLREDRRTNRTMSLLTWITTIFLPVTVITGFFSMSGYVFVGDGNTSYLLVQSVIILAFSLIVITIILTLNKRRKI